MKTACRICYRKTWLVRRNSEDKATVVEFVLRGGKYRVRSAYILDKGQLERKIKAQDAVSEPIPDSITKSVKLSQGGGMPYDMLHTEPNKNIPSSSPLVKLKSPVTELGKEPITPIEGSRGSSIKTMQLRFIHFHLMCKRFSLYVH